MKTRKLSAAALQELVAAAVPRGGLVVSQIETPVRLETTICGPDPDRWVRVWIEPHATRVTWLWRGKKPAQRRARPGRSLGDTSLDAINLIRTACAWVLGDRIPDWTELAADWEWDDPDYGTAEAEDDCGDWPKGGA